MRSFKNRLQFGFFRKFENIVQRGRPDNVKTSHVDVENAGPGPEQPAAVHALDAGIGSRVADRSLEAARVEAAVADEQDEGTVGTAFVVRFVFGETKHEASFNLILDCAAFIVSVDGIAGGWCRAKPTRLNLYG